MNSKLSTAQLPSPAGCESRTSGKARQDIRGIADHIGQESPGRALKFIVKLRLQAQDLAEYPLASPLLPRFEEAGIRRRVFRSYLILYKVEANHVVIVRILHGARDYAALLFPESRTSKYLLFEPRHDAAGVLVLTPP